MAENEKRRSGELMTAVREVFSGLFAGAGAAAAVSNLRHGMFFSTGRSIKRVIDEGNRKSSGRPQGTDEARAK